jgi:DNA-binding transcriptional regulator YbjK
MNSRSRTSYAWDKLDTCTAIITSKLALGELSTKDPIAMVIEKIPKVSSKYDTKTFSSNWHRIKQNFEKWTTQAAYGEYFFLNL